MTTRSATVNLSRPSRWIPKPRLKRLQSTFAAKLRKANYLSISVKRLKLAELNWLKLTLRNPTYKAHCFPQLNIHKFHRRQDNAQVAQARYMSSSMLTFALLHNSSNLHIYKDLYGERNKPEKLPLNYNKNRLPEFQRRFLCVLCDFLTDLEQFSVV